MNADLMITIAFCLIVLFGSLAKGVLFASAPERQSERGPETKSG